MAQPSRPRATSLFVLLTETRWQGTTQEQQCDHGVTKMGNNLVFYRVVLKAV